MINEFENNDNYTIGVEEEYMICDPLTGELVHKAEQIMSNIPDDLVNRFSYELILSEIESNTNICKDVDEAISEMIKYRNLLKNIGENLNYKIAINGTHPTALPKDQKFVNNDSYSWVKNQLQYYATRNITFSTHVHIGVNSPENAISITNTARRWIAPLLSLSVNSPFFEGVLTGMKSSRTFQFSTFPRTNIPSYISNVEEYYSLIDKYIKSKSINKARQIWWKIRPHIEYGTVEFRMCDAQRSIKKNKAIISLMQALVHTINENNDFNSSNYNDEYLNDALWKAARKGLDCKIIDPLDENIYTMRDMINKMIDYLYKSLDHFNNVDIINTVQDILKNGTEHDEQMIVYKEKGFDGLKKYLIDDVDYYL